MPCCLRKQTLSISNPWWQLSPVWNHGNYAPVLRHVLDLRSQSSVQLSSLVFILALVFKWPFSRVVSVWGFNTTVDHTLILELSPNSGLKWVSSSKHSLNPSFHGLNLSFFCIDRNRILINNNYLIFKLFFQKATCRPMVNHIH